MIKLLKHALLLTLILSFFVSFSLVCAADTLSEETQTSLNYDSEDYSAGYKTTAFHTDIIVNENNTYDIKVRIDADFIASDSHGIFYYVPYRGTQTREINGKIVTTNYRVKIYDIKVDGYAFDVSSENDNTVIKIGSETLLVSGRQTYNISYKMRANDDGFSDFDDFYFNLFPINWDTTIHNPTATITMPKSFDSNNMSVVYGDISGGDAEKIDYTVNGLKIDISLTHPIVRWNAVTVKINLPEGYFTGEHTYTAIENFMYILCALLAALVVFLFIKYGRNPHVTPVVSFYPPEGMTSAEVGYIIDGTVDDRDVVSLIIYWASKGYLSINEVEKENFVLTKLKDLPHNAKKYEKTMFDELFRGRIMVALDDLTYEFSETFKTTKSLVDNQFKSNDENRLYTKASLTARAAATFLYSLPLVIFAFTNVYIKALSSENLIFAVTGYILMLIIGKYMSGLYQRKNSKSSFTFYSMSVISYIIPIAYILYIVYLGFTSFAAPIPAILFGIITLFGASLVKRMPTRTEKSVKWLEEILGLKQFIKSAELERLNMLVTENPEYFYVVLPYAYSLGLTDKWAKNFESIAMEPPQWYRSYTPMDTFFAIGMMRNLNRCMSSATHSLTVVKPPENTGRGGGFSVGGGGGGGFAGGGMGGGGGGRW